MTKSERPDSSASSVNISPTSNDFGFVSVKMFRTILNKRGTHFRDLRRQYVPLLGGGSKVSVGSGHRENDARYDITVEIKL